MAATWQTAAVAFAEAHDLAHQPEVHALDLVSEVGEIAKALLLATAYGERPFTAAGNDELAGELGDALYSLCLLAATVDVDLDQALAATLAKYARRWRAKGNTGSQ